MKFGILGKNQKLLTDILKKYIANGTVIIYDSRAKGIFTRKSDVDLVIKDSDVIDTQVTENIRDEVSESDFPYFIDIAFFENIKKLMRTKTILIESVKYSTS